MKYHKKGVHCQTLAILGEFLVILSPGEYRKKLLALATFRRKGRVSSPRERTVRFYINRQNFIAIPRGLVGRAGSIAPIEVVDRRLLLPPVDFGWRGQLRPEQAEIAQQLARTDGGMLVANTGAGKTETAMALVASFRQPTLWLTNAKGLTKQALARARVVFNLPPKAYGYIGEGEFSIGTHFTAANLQSLAKGRHRGIERRFGTIVMDECFVAGTMVGYKYIEDYQEGDILISFDMAKGKLCVSYVSMVYKQKVGNILVKVSINGTETICTPNHPFWTNKGWVIARDLLVDGSIYVRRLHYGSLYKLWNNCFKKQNKMVHTLFRFLQTRETNQTRSCIKNEGKIKVNKPSSLCARREWPSTSRASDNAYKVFRQLAERVCSSYSYAKRLWLSHLLQVGYCKSRNFIRNRSRWLFPLRPIQESTGFEKDRVIERVRVDNIEVLEPGSDRTFGGLCPDGFVYNLEVAGTHTYFANGFLVHNCDLAPTVTYSGVISRFPAKYRLGMTATPQRGDGLGPLALAILGPSMMTIDEHKLVENKRIFVPSIRMVPSAFMYWGSGEWADVQRSRAVDMARNRLICGIAARELRLGNKVAVLVELKPHARLLVNMLVRLYKVPAVLSMGPVPMAVRGKAYKAAEGGHAVLVATKVYDRGIDTPAIERLILAAPGRSVSRLTHQIGRIMRVLEGKEDAVVYDVADVRVEVLLDQARNRLAWYHEKGYRVVSLNT